MKPTPQTYSRQDQWSSWSKDTTYSPPQRAVHQSTHSVVMGYILWIFGFTGAHRFYYGRQITGTIWFLTGGLLLVGWLVDVLLIPSMDRSADIRYRPGPLDYNVAWILLTFLGVFGVHRFYMEKWISGIVYLLTGALLGLGWLYDLWTLNEQISQRNAELTW